MRAAALSLLLVPLLCCGTSAHPVDTLDAGGTGDAANAYAAEVISVTYGAHAGFGQEHFPDVVLGPPHGGGEHQGGTDVLSLGSGGSITLRMGALIVDGEGPDFTVFENPFRVGQSMNSFAEPARVELSDDGESFVAFPCTTDSGYPYPGCAGVKPVLAPGPDGGISPLNPAVSGGDTFDLHDIGVTRARYVRITDVSLMNPSSNNAGFDLDAVVVINAAVP